MKRNSPEARNSCVCSKKLSKAKKKLQSSSKILLGNSAIISKKAIVTKLSKEEAEELNTGMIVFDVDKSELVHDVSDNIQPLGGD